MVHEATRFGKYCVVFRDVQIALESTGIFLDGSTHARTEEDLSPCPHEEKPKSKSLVFPNELERHFALFSDSQRYKQTRDPGENISFFQTENRTSTRKCTCARHAHGHVGACTRVRPWPRKQLQSLKAPLR